MSPKRWSAPAKLNLFLHITGRRDDGMHLLQTAFQFVDLGDVLEINVRDDGGIHLLNSIADVADSDNLIIRAANALRRSTGCKLGADIKLEKNLPMGGGLGGGSSDAATTLVALNTLWQTGLSTEQLADIGLALGADVPIFVHGKAAWAEGVGEQFSEVELPEPWFLVLIPACEVNTGEIFADSRLTRDCSPITIRNLLSGQASNVCEAVVVQHFPPVAQALEWLGQYSPAKMTGTGACVFAAFDSRTQAEEVLAQRPANLQGFVAKGCNTSPLY